jgi:hypothetical protein
MKLWIFQPDLPQRRASTPDARMGTTMPEPNIGRSEPE